MLIPNQGRVSTHFGSSGPSKADVRCYSNLSAIACFHPAERSGCHRSLHSCEGIPLPIASPGVLPCSVLPAGGRC